MCYKKLLVPTEFFFLFQEFLKTKQEARDPRVINNMELDKYIANFLISVRKIGGGEYEPDSLTSKYNSIARYLKDAQPPRDIKKSKDFEHSRQVLAAKRKQLKSMGKGNRPHKANRMEDAEIRILKEKGELGIGEHHELFLSA